MTITSSCGTHVYGTHIPMSSNIYQDLDFPVRKSCVLCRGHGFGYDAKSDDYKCIRIFIYSADIQSQVHIYSFRSNTWKLMHIPYKLITEADNYVRAPNGVFCNGALHWFARTYGSSKDLLLAFNIGDEGIREIPQPENLGVENFGPRKHVDVLDRCICILYSNSTMFEVWLMKDMG
ncbi:F-box/kelch-repeat protein At3g23880-like [Papaver somniferum]|uniref:F-box/kelch-repeat protein At3g23880-like n=1 Tax=Papaver somniferum TaxID=3469 RepID=UPI000E704FA6|nr:F-box/kelch-repeat protein At3g23880-like [Papaver somniferum]